MSRKPATEEARLKRNAEARAWRAENHERLAEAKRAYRAANREKTNAQARASRAKDPERVRANVRAWFKNNPEKMRGYRVNNLERRLCQEAKSRAKKRGIPFNLEPSDIVVPEFCPVLGLALVVGRGGLKAHSPTLDRIAPARGYVKGNVIVVSWRANRLKSDGTLPELRAILRFYEAMA